MICMANPPESFRHGKDSVENMHIAVHGTDDAWDLVLIIATDWLRTIMQQEVFLVRVIDHVPGFGRVTPFCLVLMSSRTRKNLTGKELVDRVLTINPGHYVGVIPVIISHETAVILRKRKMAAMGIIAGEAALNTAKPAVSEAEMDIWKRLKHVVLLLADTPSEVRRVINKLKQVPGIRVAETGYEDEHMR